jgi:hypothetical protein
MATILAVGRTDRMVSMVWNDSQPSRLRGQALGHHDVGANVGERRGEIVDLGDLGHHMHVRLVVDDRAEAGLEHRKIRDGEEDGQPPGPAGS